MRDRTFTPFIERARRDQAQKLMAAGGIEVGDYISRDSWFKDVWTRVLEVYVCIEDPLRFSHVKVVFYGNHGKSRCVETVYFGDIRAVNRTRPEKGLISDFDGF